MESVDHMDILRIVGIIGEEEENHEGLIEHLKRERDALTQKIRLLRQQKQKKYCKNKLDEISKIVEDLEQLSLVDITGIREQEALISKLSKQLEEMALDERKEDDSETKRMRIPSLATGESADQIPETRKTILLLGGCYREMLILSQDRSEWLKVPLKTPENSLSSYFGFAYLYNELYAIEGYTSSLHKLGHDMEWISLAQMKTKRTEITNSYVELNGYIWVLGGLGEGGGALTSVERYDPKEDKWIEMPGMKYGRWHAAAAVCHDKIIICGGIGDKGLKDFLSSVECFDPETGIWTELAGLPSPVHRHSLVAFGNKIITMAGKGKVSCIQSVWQLDPMKEQAKWKNLPSLNYKCFDMVAIALDEKIYAIGGHGYSSLTKSYQRLERVEVLEKDSHIRNYWQEGLRLPEGSSYDSAVIVSRDFADRLCKYNP